MVGSEVTGKGRVFQMAMDECLKLKALSAKTVLVCEGVIRFLISVQLKNIKKSLRHIPE